MKNIFKKSGKMRIINNFEEKNLDHWFRSLVKINDPSKSRWKNEIEIHLILPKTKQTQG